MTHHDEELAFLKERLLVMAGQAEDVVSRAIQALIQRDDTEARRVQDADRILDDLEKEIDEIAMQLLMKAPMAGELRLITTAMKISRDLERVGDEATTISRRVIELNTEPQLKPYVDIPRMARIALEMLKQSLDAFVNREPARAKSIIPRDKDVDLINKQLHRELASYMIEKPTTITRCLNLMTISKAIERIADHATNIAEEVVFICEGKDIRHTAALASPLET